MILASSVARVGDLRPDLFPGRWNPQRAIPADTEPAATAAAIALEEARWWSRASGAASSGGLVFASVEASHIPALRFAMALRDRPSGPVGPADFLFSLPSTTAAVLGILFGFKDYQATVAGGLDAAARALRHAVDLLYLERIERALVVALHAGQAGRIAAAWCLGGPPAGSTRDQAESWIASEGRIWLSMVQEGNRPCPQAMS